MQELFDLFGQLYPVAATLLGGIQGLIGLLQPLGVVVLLRHVDGQADAAFCFGSREATIKDISDRPAWRFCGKGHPEARIRHREDS